MNQAPSIVWFRNDLRLRDNDALLAAIEAGGPIVPCFIWDPEESDEWQPGRASKVWLKHSLNSLRKSLEERGLRLIIRRGLSARELRRLLAETGAQSIFWNRCYEPRIFTRDSQLESQLKSEGIDARSWNASLLIEPESLLNKAGKPYQVFTAFWKACLNREFQIGRAHV